MPEHNELRFSKGLKGANKKCPQDASLEQLLKDVSSFTLEPVVVLLFHVMTASFKVNGYPVSAKTHKTTMIKTSTMSSFSYVNAAKYGC